MTEDEYMEQSNEPTTFAKGARIRVSEPGRNVVTIRLNRSSTVNDRNKVVLHGNRVLTSGALSLQLVTRYVRLAWIELAE